MARWDVAAASARLAAAALACGTAQASIYTCVDGKGRRITQDRPITECLDREQKELSPNGLPRRVLGPSLSPREQAAKEAVDRKAAEERLRLAEEKRQERALLARYPNELAFRTERDKALEAVENNAAETQRVQKRFEEEHARLRVLWGAAKTAAVADPR